jgi:DNA (cytosine-5)-methyltransferase 1
MSKEAKLHELALCAGIAGLSRGLQDAGIRTACYVERDDYRIQVLISRIRDGWLDDAPIWDDVTTFDGQPWRGRVDIISAGFPCQPFSTAGKKRREQDERYIWPDICRIIRQIGPRFVLLENVSGLLMGDRRKPASISNILGDLVACGYDAEWQSIQASSFGAPHERERVFVVAYPHKSRWTPILRTLSEICIEAYAGWTPNHLDTPGGYIQAMEERICQPSVCRSNDGTAYRVERLEAVGEAVVRQVAAAIGKCIVEADAQVMLEAM